MLNFNSALYTEKTLEHIGALSEELNSQMAKTLNEMKTCQCFLDFVSFRRINY